MIIMYDKSNVPVDDKKRVFKYCDKILAFQIKTKDTSNKNTEINNKIKIAPQVNFKSNKKIKTLKNMLTTLARENIIKISLINKGTNCNYW